MTWHAWLAFVGVWLVILVSPGPNLVFILATGNRHGLRAAMTAGAGIATGALLHVSLIILGLGALLAASATVFEAIRWAGVAYLVWLGIAAWRNAGPKARDDTPAPAPRRRRLAAQGFLIAIANPKAIALYLLLLPPFIDPDRAAAPQFLVLGATAVGLSFAYYGLCAAALGLVKDRFASPRAARLRDRLFGTLFFGLAAALALAERK
ncbi:MAG: LysE family translocator [Rhodobacterales bacterium]|nr:LysE family translocator [Rhodobacterales bacterium]